MKIKKTITNEKSKCLAPTAEHYYDVIIRFQNIE